MKSNRNTRAVTVGIFVAVGLAIFVAAVLALGGQRKTFADTITIKSVFDDVNGLNLNTIKIIAPKAEPVMVLNNIKQFTKAALQQRAVFCPSVKTIISPYNSVCATAQQ